MWPMGGAGWGWWMAVGWLMVVGIAVLIVWAVALLAPWRSGGQPITDEPSAMDILERRYASGELTDAQFEAMRQRLRQPPGSSRGE